MRVGEAAYSNEGVTKYMFTCQPINKLTETLIVQCTGHCYALELETLLGMR